MSKIVRIAIKDLRVLFQDWAALVLMLAAPLVLTLGMGFVTGSFDNDSNGVGIQAIPVTLVNADEGDLGRILSDTFTSPDLSDLFAVTKSDDPDAAKAAVDQDESAAVVIVPAGFSAGIVPDPASGEIGEPQTIEVYSNPARPISSSVTQSIVQAFVQEVTTGSVIGRVAVEQMMAARLIDVAQIPDVAATIGAQLGAAGPAEETPVITLNSAEAAAPPQQLDPLAFFAPAMALLFLMYTVTRGAQSILSERDDGTMARILTTPTSIAQLLGGKTAGTFLSGVAQVGILIVGTTLLFQLNWGDPLGVALLIVFVAAAATGWGILIAAVARTPGQVASIGTAIMLLFAILSGTFFGPSLSSGLLDVLGSITPNKWALDGFVVLAEGGTAGELLPMLGALAIMATALFLVAIPIFSRQWRTSR